MKRLLKNYIKKTRLFYLIQNWLWHKKGKPLPAPHTVKQKTLYEYAKRFQLGILIETGTFYGDMVEAMKGSFDQIYSIELSKALYDSATRRFHGVNNITLIHGDSGIKLGEVMKKINRPALFWLDGHYSGGITAKGEKITPIYEELKHILRSEDMAHVIIIDDARCFGINAPYPSIENLISFVKSRKPNANITVQDDMIRIVPT